MALCFSVKFIYTIFKCKLSIHCNVLFYTSMQHVFKNKDIKGQSATFPGKQSWIILSVKTVNYEDLNVLIQWRS